ncbi:hypothetical protein ACVBEG_27420 [Pseudomonas sp. GG8]
MTINPGDAGLESEIHGTLFFETFRELPQSGTVRIRDFAYSGASQRSPVQKDRSSACPGTGRVPALSP